MSRADRAGCVPARIAKAGLRPQGGSPASCRQYYLPAVLLLAGSVTSSRQCYLLPVPGEVPVVEVPGATCDFRSPGEPCDCVASDESGFAPVPPEVLPPVAAGPPGDCPDVVPGAACERISPGEPCERVASPAAPGVPLGVVAVPVLPLGAPPPGDCPDCIVPGAACVRISPGEPCDLVASDPGVVDCAKAPPAAISTQAENTAVFILFMSRSS